MESEPECKVRAADLNLEIKKSYNISPLPYKIRVRKISHPTVDKLFLISIINLAFKPAPATSSISEMMYVRSTRN